MPEPLHNRFFLQAVLLLSALLVSSFSSASLITLRFDIDVTDRENHDGSTGIGLNNWVTDTGYGGDRFLLDFQVDTATLDPDASLFDLVAQASLSSIPATPFDTELDALLTRWPGLSITSARARLSHSVVNFSPIEYQTYFELNASGSDQNHPDIFFASDLASRQLRLTYAADTQLFSDQQHVDGYLITEQDLTAYLQSLVAEAVEFDFTQSAQQLLGTFSDFLNDDAYLEGLRYTGTARLVAVDGLVPVAGTGLLLAAALPLLALFGRRQGGTFDLQK